MEWRNRSLSRPQESADDVERLFHRMQSSATSSKTAKASPAVTAASTGGPKARKGDTTSEIEEISKKISEHAEAIYRTWKCRGLAPTELLELYTNAGITETTAGASDFFAAAAAAAAEAAATPAGDDSDGLQKLVRNFVLKDKEQRGVKTLSNKGSNTNNNTNSNNNNSGSGSSSKKSTTSKSSNAEVTKVSSKPAAQKSTARQEARTDGDAPAAASVDATDAKTRKGAKTSSAAAATAATAVKSAKNGEGATQSKQLQKQIKPTAAGEEKVATPTKKASAGSAANGACSGAGIASTKSGSAPTKTKLTPAPKGAKEASTVAVNLNFDINLDLNLDVQNLSQLQTQNLMKIKELLQEKPKDSVTPLKTTKSATKIVTAAATTTATTTKVATATAVSKASAKDPLSGEARKSAKSKANNNNSSTTITNNNNDNSSVSNTSSGGGGGGSNKLINGDGVVVGALASTTIGAGNNDVKAAPNGGGGDGGGISDKSASSVCNTASDSDKTRTASAKRNPSKGANAVSEGGVEQDPATAATRATKSGSTKATKAAAKETKAAAKERAERKEAKASPAAPAEPIESDASGVASAAHPSALGVEPVMEIGRTAMPAPTKMKTAKTLTNGQDKNLAARPFLTRGSVAERVLMFEKCPEARNSFLNIKRPDPADAPPKSLLKVKLHATPPQPKEQNSLQREIRSSKSVYIPRFYFPHGKPQPQIALERTLRGILSLFDTFPNNQVTKDELPRILKLCGLPFYWRMPVMVFCQQGGSGLVERTRFVEFWKQMNVYCHDAASRFVYILSRGQRFRSHILPEDLAPLVQDVVDTHPGLAFLKEATEFHSRYVHTVIARIFYSVNRSWSGRISISELKRSDLLEIITLLEEEDDINQIMAFFSYEHFYVIYCKFWELDKDHDLLINQEDLSRHSDHALSTRIVERIFSGCVTRSDNKKTPKDEPKMSYTDFVWFLLSEEDKRTPTAIEYWFRCMDIDGDGVLSMYELEYFYEEQQQRMESIGIETLPFEDCLCQMLDMIKPAQRDCVSLGDLKRCKMTHVFFDTFFNLEKYLDHEQRDPFASQRDEYSSDWDRFAATEYELLITEEND